MQYFSFKSFAAAAAAAVLAAAPFSASAAEEAVDLLSRFDRECLEVMSGFSTAREAAVTSKVRQNFQTKLNAMQTHAASIQRGINDLGIGEDLDLAAHVHTIAFAFRTEPARKDEDQKGTSSTTKTKANDPLSRLSPSGFGNQTTIGKTAWTPGLAFRFAGNAVQTLSELGFSAKDGKYSVSPRYRAILPYLELKRGIAYYNASCPDFETLHENSYWRADFEKRLIRMRKLARSIQPVYRAYFPQKADALTVVGEVEAFNRIYNKLVLSFASPKTGSTRTQASGDSAFDQIKKSSSVDQNTLMKDYDSAAARLAEFVADMDSVDWTVNPFSAAGPKEKPASPEKPADSVKPKDKDKAGAAKPAEPKLGVWEDASVK